ncbi:MAG: PadR family transcriptional regulator [Candidatus Aminicenantes bacterium]|nr:PadR family transcriptional regulator [Candidatus Aminicenantes bacterium]
MKLLSRSEELVLLAVLTLKEHAYCVPIRKKLKETTGKSWSFGSIYDPLDRLVHRGFLKSFLSEPTKERGGRSKRIYRLTEEGKKALIEIRNIEKALWAEVTGFEI